MTIRRRPRAGAGRRPLVVAAIDLLAFAGYRQRLGGVDPAVAVAHRAAVERTLTPGELAVVDQVLSGEVRGSVAEFVEVELGGQDPDADERLEALTQILGRTPRFGG